MVSGPGERGRRQLQAPVRLRTDIVARVRPCPSVSPPAAASLETRANASRAEWIVAPSSPAPPCPARHGTFTWIAPLESNRTSPTDAGSKAKLATRVFTKRNCLGGGTAQPNEMRVSCGALLSLSQT